MALKDMKLWIAGLFGHGVTTADTIDTSVKSYAERIFQRQISCWVPKIVNKTLTVSNYLSDGAATALVDEKQFYVAIQPCTVKEVRYALEGTNSVSAVNSASDYFELTVLRRRNATTSVSKTAAVATIKSTTNVFKKRGVKGVTGKATLSTTANKLSLKAGDALSYFISKGKGGRVKSAGLLQVTVEED